MANLLGRMRNCFCNMEGDFLKNIILQFLSWDACECISCKKIKYLFEQDRKKTLAMQISSEAKIFCRGPSSAILKRSESDELSLEGSCVFSFYTQRYNGIQNIQIFQFFQYGCTKPVDELIAVRMSKWDKNTDTKATVEKKELDNWNCSAKTIVLKDDTAKSILGMGRCVGDQVKSGIDHSNNRLLADEDYVLHTIDSTGIAHSISWNNSIILPIIEGKIHELQDAISLFNPESQDYDLTFFFRK